MTGKQDKYSDFLPFREGLVDYAESLLGSRQDAEDAVQDLYLKLWSHRDNLLSVETPEAYCKTVLKRNCIDRLRSSALKGKSALPADLLSDSYDIADSIIVKEQLNAAVKAIDELPTGQKDVLKKKVILDKTYEEIALETGMNAQTMRTQLSLARKTLRSRFAWTCAALATALLIVWLAVPKAPADTFDDPVLAYAELEKTFNYISSKADKGTGLARKAEPVLDKVDAIFNNDKTH